MELVDIIIYAAIAAFLAYRLWSVLGQKEENDASHPQKPNPFSSPSIKGDDEDDVMVIEGRARPAALTALTAQGHAPTSLAGTLDQMKQIDPTFDEKMFLEGGKAAFANIVTAFAAGDLTPVLRWLGPAVWQPFEAAIAERKTKGETLENKIERIVAADIVAATQTESVATLSVEFVTYQVNILRDSGGTILDGTPGKAEEVRDLWLFRRDLTSADPNWILIETRS